MLDKEVLLTYYQELNRLSGIGLDIGCGDNPCSPLLPEGARAIAIDVSLRRKAAADIIGDCAYLPIRDEAVNFAITTFLFCSVADTEGCAAEILRVLRPGGVLLALEHGPPRSNAWKTYAKCRTALLRRFGKCNAASDPTVLRSHFANIQCLARGSGPMPWQLMRAVKE